MNVKSSRSGQGNNPTVKVAAVVVSVAVLILFIVFLYRTYLLSPPLPEVQDNDATRPSRELDTGSGGMDNDAERARPPRDTRRLFPRLNVT